MKFSRPKTLVKKWLNIRSKTDDFHPDDITCGGGDEVWKSNFSEREACTIKKSRTGFRFRHLGLKFLDHLVSLLAIVLCKRLRNLFEFFGKCVLCSFSPPVLNSWFCHCAPSMVFTSVLECSSSALCPLLRACEAIRDLNQVHAHIVRRGYQQNHFLIAQFISICTAIEPTNLSYPTSVFDAVVSPNIYLWNILMKIQCNSCYPVNECFSLLGRMRRGSNVAPDKYTFPSLIKACCNDLALREGMVVHGMAVKCGTEGDVFVGSSLIDFYGKCREIECARIVFDGMSVRNEVSWTAMMVGYLNMGRVDDAKHLFDEMPNRTGVTWNAVIKGLVKFGDL